MKPSLNEIEAICKRAARGARRDWGIAEEAGKAARWLAARGLPGPAVLADLLARFDGIAHDAVAPVSTGGVWQAAEGPLCSLAAGAALSDRAEALRAGGIETGPVAFPLLLAPYAAMAAKAAGLPLRLGWRGAAVTVFPEGGLAVEGDAAALAAAEVGGLTCVAAPGAQPMPAQRASADVDDVAWRRLESFAARTYAPATEESRRLGAGAGMTDND